MSAFELIAGVPCLDFCNTLGGRRGAKTSEGLLEYEDLLNWSRRVGILAAPVARRLSRVAALRPREAIEVFGRAIELREALARIFLKQIAGRRPARADLELLNRELRRGLAGARLVAAGDEIEWRWQGEADALDQMLTPIARSAAELLTSSIIGRVRECCGDACGWLFLDVSKNRSRRWCDMKTCGNLEKIRRHRRKLKKKSHALSPPQGAP